MTSKELIEARARLMIRAPYFSVLLYDQSKLVEISEAGVWMGLPVPTAMTDGYNIVINTNFFSTHDVDERVFILCHEVYHVMAMHPKRMRRYIAEGLYGYPFLTDLYNVAADAVINKCLVNSKIGKKPNDCVWINKVGNHIITGEEAAEEIYKLMLDQFPPQLLKSLGKVGGKQAGNEHAADIAGGLGHSDPLAKDVIPNSPDSRAAGVSEASMRAAIQTALAHAKAIGNTPGGMQRFIEEFLEPQVAWEEELATALVNKSAGRDLADWTRPNRRKLITPGVILPRRKGVCIGNVVTAIDTSASVSAKELSQYGGELASILGDLHPRKMTLIWCDAAVDGVEELTDAEEFRNLVVKDGARGGGGTSFIPPFTYVTENEIPCDVFIYYTDGYGPFPTPEQAPFDVIWCISSDVVAPFGKTIKITY